MNDNIELYTARDDELVWNRRPQHRYRCSQTSDTVALGKVRCSNGSVQYKAYCLECGGRGSNFAYGDIEHLDDERIPFITEHEVIPCERCGSEDGSERHHWAPHHLFEDADDWPVGWLCRQCHLEWHRIVTPNMSASRNNRSAA